jgi:predicted nucleic acid-binding protein
MTDLVVDSSVAVKWFLPEAYSAEASRILTEYDNGALLFIAPDLIYAEFGNIIWKKLIFQGTDANAAGTALLKVQQLKIRLTSTGSLLDDAYRLAVAHKRTVYDMLYLALSLRAGCQFVTADEKLVNAIGPAFSNVVWLANWP